MVYLTILPGIIHRVDVQPLLTAKGGIKIGDRYYYPPNWHLTLEEAKEHITAAYKSKIAYHEAALVTLKEQLNTEPQLIDGMPKEKEKGKGK